MAFPTKNTSSVSYASKNTSTISTFPPQNRNTWLSNLNTWAEELRTWGELLMEYNYQTKH